MIGIQNTPKFCCEELSSIENYYEAINDKSQIWHCHHRFETYNSDGELRLVSISMAELKALDMYYNRPASELMFLTKKNHFNLHNFCIKRDRYKNATNVNLFQLSANGEVLKQKTYRSIKELYDTIKYLDESDSLKSYKTFQRSVAKGDFNLTITVKGQVTFLVVSLNAVINKEDFIIEEVIDETELEDDSYTVNKDISMDKNNNPVYLPTLFMSPEKQQLL